MDYNGIESMNSICSNLMFIGTDTRKIAVTSCRPGDGKSFMSVQIAMNLAKRGRKIALVDADLRRSRMVAKYDITTEGEMTGLAHYLAGMCEMQDVVYQTNIENMFFVPYGHDVVNAVSLLDTDAFGDLLNSLANEFDLVIVDAPPIGLVIDAAEVARCCDGVILVAKYNVTHRRWLVDAKWQLEQTGTRILGCILNDLSFDSISSKRYYGKYYSNYDSHYGKGYYRRSPSETKSKSSKKK